jgi:hypothetical protein
MRSIEAAQGFHEDVPTVEALKGIPVTEHFPPDLLTILAMSFSVRRNLIPFLEARFCASENRRLMDNGSFSGHHEKSSIGLGRSSTTESGVETQVDTVFLFVGTSSVGNQ